MLDLEQKSSLGVSAVGRGRVTSLAGHGITHRQRLVFLTSRRMTATYKYMRTRLKLAR